MIKVGILNSDTILYKDTDISSYSRNIINPGIASDMNISVAGGNITISTGYCFIECIRSDGDKIMVPVCISTAEVIAIQNNKKLYIKIPQTNIDNPTANIDTSSIAILEWGTSYPINNYIKLGSTNSGGTFSNETILSTIKSDKINLSNYGGNILAANITSNSITTNSISLPAGGVQDQIDKLKDSGLPTIQIVDKSTFLTGQSVQIGDNLFPEVGPTLTQASAVEAIGNTSSFTRYAIPCIASGVSLSSIKLGLKKTGSPSVNLNIRLEGDNNGLPSGTLLDANGIASIAPASLTTSIVDTSILFSGTTNSNAHGVTLNTNETSQTAYKGYKFTLTTQASCVSVTKVAGSTATKCYLYDISGNLLTSATFSTNVATLNYTELVVGNSYYVVVGSDGSSYTSVKQGGSAAYPYTMTRMNAVAGVTRNAGATDTISSSYAGQFAFTVTLTTIFTATKTCKLGSVSSGSNATLYDNVTNTVIEAVTGSTFSGNTILQAGVTYKITTTYPPYGVFFGTSQTPLTGTNINISSSSFYTGSYPNSFGVITLPMIIEDTNIYNIVSISTTDNIVIPRGTKFHVVLYVGTYGSETLNSSNFYGIACMLQDTYTRYANIHNGTSYSGYITEFPYISSSGIENTLLSKTSASFIFKLPTDSIRIATENKGVGKNVICASLGFFNLYSGLTPETDYYIGNTPGTISTVAGTNIYPIGKSKSTTTLNISKYPIFGSNIGGLSSSIGSGTTGTSTSSVYQATCNELWVFIAGLYGGSPMNNARIQQSPDNVTWTTIAYADSLPQVNSSMTVYALKGYYYRTQSVSNYTNASTYANCSMVSRIINIS